MPARARDGTKTLACVFFFFQGSSISSIIVRRHRFTLESLLLRYTLLDLTWGRVLRGLRVACHCFVMIVLLLRGAFLAADMNTLSTTCNMK